MKPTKATVQSLTNEISEIPTPRGDIGTVKALIIRPQRGLRQRVDSIRLTPEGGIEGDRWGKSNQTSRLRQVSIIRADILDIFSGGDNQDLSGDNIHVDFDLSHENLPNGATLHIGNVILKVSSIKHLPCEQFTERFGKTAYDVAKSTQMLNIRARGALFEVIRGGTISTNDTVHSKNLQ